MSVDSSLLLSLFDCSLFVPVTPFETILDTRRSLELETKTTETTTWKKTLIGVDTMRDETSLSEVIPRRIAPPSERGRGDDWFILFDAIREKPLFVPPGTFRCQRQQMHTTKAHSVQSWLIICIVADTLPLALNIK